MIDIIFFITAATAIISALLTVSSHNVVHALLYLVTMMLAIALIFFLLGSPFAAALQVIVYAGAIMVLFVFVTMMLHQGKRSLAAERQLFNPKVAKGPLILSALLVIELTVLSLGSVGLHQEALIDPLSVKQLAIQLFGSYRVLVVLAAILLLAALISAIHITKQSSKPHSTSDANTDAEVDMTANLITSQLTPAEIEPSQSQTSKARGKPR
ncbi:NADH dehydrogenase subunit J [Shewanella psychrophila]|uniref:NADH-quinone oxidoreductase subunit J n=1 Tax=Shewanella psychrophila TaxID=225848 RepID=A0A1S6HT53_9GAMM|nr:NADH-quinone oxidoreductase subunit J [Shewanella psychrophila]AQS38681.1 NADH dehydrogenase subunit J [Shewanella psychrophila]